MEKQRIAIIFAPPVKRRYLHSFLKKIMKQANVIDVESEFCKKFPEPHELQSIIPKNSRETIQKKWNEAITEAFTIMTHAETNKDLNFLLCHTLYYKSSTKEFFSVFNPGFLKQLAEEKNMEISHMILINDDIYDIYKRLTEPTKLYGNDSFFTFMENYSENLDLSHTKMQNNKQAYLSWIQFSLNSLINWKSQEILLAQNFANQLNCRFLYWAIKQNIEILKTWIEKDERIFYISHPITQPRKKQIKSGKWDSLVDTINNIQTKFAKNDLLTVTPTSIDEYRFGKKKKKYTGKLTGRWPLPKEVKKKLEKSKLIDPDIDKKDILFPLDLKFKRDDFTIVNRKKAKIKNIQNDVNTIFTSLEMSVLGALANRDHSLVMHTDGIIVIEPWSDKKNEVHGGIGKELEYLFVLNQSYEAGDKIESKIQHPRKLCAVFLESTLKNIIAHKDFKKNTISKLKFIIQKTYELTPDTVERIIDENGKLHSTTTGLGPLGIDAPTRTRITQNLDSLKDSAILQEFLARTMSLTPKSTSYLCVLFIKNLQALNTQSIISKIKNCLTTKNYSTGWESFVLKEAKKKKLF